MISYLRFQEWTKHLNVVNAGLTSEIILSKAISVYQQVAPSYDLYNILRKTYNGLAQGTFGVDIFPERRKVATGIKARNRTFDIQPLKVKFL